MDKRAINVLFARCAHSVCQRDKRRFFKAIGIMLPREIETIPPPRRATGLLDYTSTLDTKIGWEFG